MSELPIGGAVTTLGPRVHPNHDLYYRLGTIRGIIDWLAATESSPQREELLERLMAECTALLDAMVNRG